VPDKDFRPFQFNNPYRFRTDFIKFRHPFTIALCGKKKKTGKQLIINELGTGFTLISKRRSFAFQKTAFQRVKAYLLKSEVQSFANTHKIS